jgi:hypothetical protein
MYFGLTNVSRTKFGPVMLERHRVDDVDGGIGSFKLTEEQTIDGLTGIFESMNDEFGVGEVLETKDWA